MKQFIPCVAVFLCGVSLAYGTANTDLLTVAESSEFARTSLHDDVMVFVRQLQKRSNHIRVETLCKSAEGRDVPLLILGNPVPASVAQLKHDDRLVVYIQANIHAGEVEGKEAVQMLARDMLLGDKQTFLEGLIVLITPIFNSDGNEKLGHNRRDKGPELAGVRHNGLMLDLNRDGIKLESSEVRAMVSTILNQWDPALFVDCHTTNGSYHDEPVTYAWPLNPNGDQDIIRFMRDNMMPWVDQDLEQSYKTLSIPYGNFVDPHQPEKGWVSSDPQCRYLTNYVGLRNRLSILLENYSYADFETRVWGNYHFLLSVLQYCQENRRSIQTLLAEADHRVVLKGLNPAQAGSFGMDYERKALDRTVDILGYEHEPYTDAEGRKRVRKTDTKKVYTCPLLYDWILTRTVQRPSGYFIAVNDPWVIDTLKHHGILVERLTESVKLIVESFTPETLGSHESLFQGHRMNRLEGRYEAKEMPCPKGTVFVSTAQPLGNLVVYLLEPECDDGLFAWNFFDRYLVKQWQRRLPTVPVHRLMHPVHLVKTKL
jgi:hypothetical protein